MLKEMTPCRYWRHAGYVFIVILVTSFAANLISTFSYGLDYTAHDESKSANLKLLQTWLCDLYTEDTEPRIFFFSLYKVNPFVVALPFTGVIFLRGWGCSYSNQEFAAMREMTNIQQAVYRIRSRHICVRGFIYFISICFLFVLASNKAPATVTATPNRMPVEWRNSFEIARSQICVSQCLPILPHFIWHVCRFGYLRHHLCACGVYFYFVSIWRSPNKNVSQQQNTEYFFIICPRIFDQRFSFA